MLTGNLRPIFYKGGVSMVARDDDPTYQCKSCFKPWWSDEVAPLSTCQHCNGQLRKLTEAEPLKA